MGSISAKTQGSALGLLAGTDYAGRQSVGARSCQEDAYGVVPPEDFEDGRTLLVVVADGMGGHAAGEIASEVALGAFVDGFFDSGHEVHSARLWAGLEAANREIGRRVASDQALAGMGTTLVAVLIHGTQAQWISVGDSPLYLLRGASLQRLNRLHLADSDELGGKADSNSQLPRGSHALTAAVVGERLSEVDDPPPIGLEPDDLLIAASDGINSLSESELAEVILKCRKLPASQCAEALLEAVVKKAAPRQDNTTVVIVRWRRPES